MRIAKATVIVSMLFLCACSTTTPLKNRIYFRGPSEMVLGELPLHIDVKTVKLKNHQLSISGVVKDEKKDPFAEVTIYQISNNRKIEIGITNNQGRFEVDSPLIFRV